MIQDEAAEAEAIADIVNGLGMLHGNPEKFHLHKDEASRRLRAMAKRLRGGGSRRELHQTRPIARTAEARRDQVSEGERRGTTWRP